MAFQFAPILWAGGAAAAPVVIHMILRTKPRKVRFPAVEFIRKVHQANIKMHRLKHLILLLMRAAAIFLIVFLIARWSIADWRTVAAASEPTAAALVIDNSGSMGYRSGNQALLERGKSLARQVMGKLPSGSRAAVITTASPDSAVGFIGDLGRAAEQAGAVSGTYGDESLAAAVRRAVGLLDNVADLERKEVYIISDMTAQSWRDGSGARLKADADKSFVVVDCGAGDVNAALGDLRLSAWSVPVGCEVVIRTEVRRPRQGPELSLAVELNGRVVSQKILQVAPGASRPVTLLVRPTAKGAAAGKVALTGLAGQDPLEMDNERHFALLVGSPARLLAVRDRASLRDRDETSVLMEAAAAPPGASAIVGQRVVKTATTSDALSAERLKEADAVLLANVSGLTPAQWRALKSHVEEGGNLWIVAGRLVSPGSYNAAEAQELVPLELDALEEKTGGMRWKIPKGGRGHPLVEPFLAGDNPPLTEVRCRRRFGVKSVAAAARVIVSYDDGVPAIVWRDAGDGAVVFWNFSPAREFSNLARLAQFVVLAQRTEELMIGGWESMYFWADTVTVPVPKRMSAPAAEVQPPGENFRPAAGLDAGARSLTIRRADRLGHWRVRFTEQGRPPAVRGFSVNAAYAESNLTAAKEEDIREMFPPGRLLVTRDARRSVEARRTVSQNLDLGVPLLLALLALVTAESFFANRFYRRAAGGDNAAAAGAAGQISG